MTHEKHLIESALSDECSANKITAGGHGYEGENLEPAPKAQHTPGPWNAATSASSVVGWPIVAQSGRPIANMTCVPKGFPNEEAINAEVLANARLIAAAPELLEALRTVFYVDAFSELPRETKDKVVAAISKTRGAA